MIGQHSGMILAEVDFYIKGLLKYTLFGQEFWITTTHVSLFIVTMVLLIIIFVLFAMNGYVIIPLLIGM